MGSGTAPDNPDGRRSLERAREVVVIGAGPAGLTAAYQLTALGFCPTVVEADDVVGGIARTVQRDGWRFDIGGHRFFTKVPAVRRLWEEILGADDFLLRPRMSRIYYRGKMFDYPLRAFNALKGLGPIEAGRCLLSYCWAQVRRPTDQSTFEGWVSARFGRRLYSIFFKTYTEKVWGMPATRIQADWAAQRIKNLSLMKAVTNAILPRRNHKDITSLIEEFHYPRCGPGMMWETARNICERRGARIAMRTRVVRVHHRDGEVVGVTVETDGVARRLPASAVISSMPLSDLVAALDPPAPDDVLRAARSLRYRDFLTVALIVPEGRGFPDNWIYIHDPEVSVGRIQNYGSWSPHMVKEGRTCLGLEYFVNRDDGLWSMSDGELIELAKRELDQLRLCAPAHVEMGYVVRMPKAYPVYDETYRDALAVIRTWLETQLGNLYTVGRNGMHKYNNQDHSMYTAMCSVENILGASHDVWAVNVEADYHEEGRREQEEELSRR